MLPELSVISLRHGDRCTVSMAVKLCISCCAPDSVVIKQNETRLQLHTCVFQASLSNVHHQSGDFVSG